MIIKEKQGFAVLYLDLVLLFWATLLASESPAHSQGIVLHHFYISQDTGTPVYLSAELPDADGAGPVLEQIPSLQSRLEQLAPDERLLVVKQAESHDQSASLQPVGLELHPGNFLPDQVSCAFSRLFPGLLPSSDIEFYGNPIEIHTLQGNINPQCSQVKTADGGAIPFGSTAAEYESWPDGLWLIEIPPLKHTDQESDTGSFGVPGVLNPTDSRELLSGSYGGGSGPGFDFKPGGGGGGGGSSLMDISVTLSLLPTASEKRVGNRPVLVLGSQEGVSIEVTDANGYQWRQFYTMDEARELLEGVEDGEHLLSRLKGGNLVIKAGMVEDLPGMCRESLRTMGESVPGIISYPNGKNEQEKNDASASEPVSQASGTGNNRAPTRATGSRVSSGMGAGDSGRDRENEDHLPKRLKTQCEISEAEMEVNGETYIFLFNDESGQEHEITLVSKERYIHDLKCKICLNICNDASSYCNTHLYCRKCLSTVTDRRCPECRKTWGILGRVGFADRQINSLKVYCPNKEHGCKETPEIVDLGRHYQSCPFKGSCCSNDGCDFFGMPQAISEHRMDCQYQITDCVNLTEGCDKKVILKEMDAHLDSCPFLVVGCSNINCPTPIHRYEEEAHQNECPFSLISCDHEGCEHQCLRMEMDTHKSTECMYLTIPCEYCQIEHKRLEMEQHKQACKYRPESCSLCNRIISSDDMSNHLALCLENFHSECDGCMKLADAFRVGFKKQISTSNEVEAELKSKIEKMEAGFKIMEQQINLIAQQQEEASRQNSGTSTRAVADRNLLDTIPFYNCELRLVPGKNNVYKAYGPRVDRQTTCFVLQASDIDKFYSDENHCCEFTTYIFSYHMRLSISRNEEHLSVYVNLIAGDNDYSVSWPFNKKIHIGVINREGAFTREHDFNLQPEESDRPVFSKGRRGYRNFLPLTDIPDLQVRDDNLVFFLKLE